jgi:uncharacterized protein (TIGR01777 family)
VLSRDVQRANRLVQDASSGTAGERGAAVRVAAWDSLAHSDGLDELALCDAVVHLAGAPAVGRRWTPRVKREIYESRILPTRSLVQALAQAEPCPRAFVSASAVGYYGARGGAEGLDEDAPAGTDFLATLCRDWEAAAAEAAPHGSRVVHARLGIVLGPGGGALEQMVKPFKAFAGGPIGTGAQVVSWVHLEDVVRAFMACLDDERLAGPVNVTAPQPVANADLMREIGRILRRPAWISVPAAALRLRFGEGAEPLLTGQRVLPRQLQASGFQWRFADVRSALDDLLG